MWSAATARRSCLREFSVDSGPAKLLWLFTRGGGADGMPSQRLRRCRAQDRRLRIQPRRRPYHDADAWIDWISKHAPRGKAAGVDCHHAEEQGTPAEPHKILCAAGYTRGASNLIQWASEFSQRMQADLCSLHVVPILGDKGYIQADVAQETLAKLEALKKSAWIPAFLEVASGEIAETIREHAQGAHLLNIGREFLSSPVGRLRSNAYVIIQQSPSSVLSV